MPGRVDVYKRQRLKVLHGVFHPEGEPFSFSFDWLTPSGLSTKDFIAPSSFRFGEGRYFRMGKKIGAASFLEILAPELNDRMLADILDLETGVIVNLHIRRDVYKRQVICYSQVQCMMTYQYWI